MTQQIFVNSSKFSAPVMTLDRSDQPKQGGGSLVAHENKMALTNRICRHILFDRLSLQEQFFVCDKSYLPHKIKANMPVFRQTCSSPKIQWPIFVIYMHEQIRIVT